MGDFGIFESCSATLFLEVSARVSLIVAINGSFGFKKIVKI